MIKTAFATISVAGTDKRASRWVIARILFDLQDRDIPDRPVAHQGNMEGGGGGGGFTNGGKYIRQLGGVGERCILPQTPRSLASYHFYLTSKIVHVYAHASAS